MFKTAITFATLIASAAADAESGSWAGSGSAAGAGEVVVEEVTTTQVQTVLTTTGKAPTSTHLAAAMLADLMAAGHGADTEVVVKLVQKATVPISDDGTLCDPAYTATVATAVLTVAEEAMGDGLSMREGAPLAWKANNNIGGACAAVSGRRRLQTHTVGMGVEATEDVSQHVNGAAFETTLTSNLQSGMAAAAAADTSGALAAANTAMASFTVPTIDTSAIAYEQTVTYEIKSTTTLVTPTQASMQAAVNGALTASGLFSPAEIAAVVVAAPTVTVCSAASQLSGGCAATTTVAIAGAFTSAVSAGLLAAGAASLFL
eukprot:SAG22_NODE_964_length_6277_cov_12.416316_6_plen_318_part_00